MQRSKLGMWKGYHLSLEGIQKGYLFCLKWYIQRVKGWSLGQSLFGEYPPPPPLWVTVTLVWFFSLISLILCFIKWIKIHLKASCPFFENPDMLKEIMSPGGEIKSGKMGSKIYCVILHALSKRNVATIHIQLCVFTEKHIGTPIFCLPSLVWDLRLFISKTTDSLLEGLSTTF